MAAMLAAVRVARALNAAVLASRASPMAGAATTDTASEWPTAAAALRDAHERLRRNELVAVLADADELLSLLPAIVQLANARLPAVLHVHIGPADTEMAAVRQAGAVLLYSVGACESRDMAAAAFAIALRARLPVLHAIHASEPDHGASEMVLASTLDAEALLALLPMPAPNAHRAPATGPAGPMATPKAGIPDIGSGAGDVAPATAVTATDAAPGDADSNAQQTRDATANRRGHAHRAAGDPSDELESSNAAVYLDIRAGTASSAAFAEAADTVDGVFQLLSVAPTRAPYRLFENAGSTDAELVLVALEPVALQLAALLHHPRVGILSVRAYRPWSTRHFCAALPKSARRLAVVEYCGNEQATWGALHLDVLATVASAVADRPSMVIGNTLDAPATAATVATVVDNALSASPAAGLRFTDSRACAADTRDPRAAPNESPAMRPYAAALHHLFHRRLAIVDPSGRVVHGPDRDEPRPALVPCASGEYGLGAMLGMQQQREQFARTIARMLADPAGVSDDELRGQLGEWLANRNDAQRSTALAGAIVARLEREQPVPAALREIYAMRHLLPKPSCWLIGDAEWMRDLAGSGLHNLLAAREDINVLVLSTDSATGAPTDRRRKDVGLYAMNYGEAYVASVAVHWSYTQLLHALMEADAFSGPSIVLAYAHVAADNDAVALLRATKRVVDSGVWPLYRWNPRSERDELRFQLDSDSVRDELRDFLRRDSSLGALARSEPDISPALAGSLEGDVRSLERRLAESFTRLLSAASGPPLLVLYASDGGNAEGLARRLSKEAQWRGLLTRCDAMDSFAEALADLASEPRVVFIVSTAGQGEFPANGAQLWSAIEAATDAALLAGMKFAVFALGDSNYWPHPGDAHLFAKAGRDLDGRLPELGAERFHALGIGDDQAPDGYETGYRAWEPGLWATLGVADAVGDPAARPAPKLTDDEMKRSSNYLRGTIADGLADLSTGAISERDAKLTKFHGIYQQDDRDLRDDRRRRGVEKAYSFMVRIRVPGGVATPQQWLVVDALADSHGNGTFKLTTRQAFQLHGVLKRNLKATVQRINAALMDTLAACGDVNRNVMCNPNPYVSRVHGEAYRFACRLSEHLSPRTTAYHEIWLDQKHVAGGDAAVDLEPLYGPTYLPRKFKIAVAIPPHNDVDVFAHDLGFITIVDEAEDRLHGFNVTVGGGMGMTHGKATTFPRLADVLGFCRVEQAVDVAEKVMLVQRDYGDRTNRKHARLKYTIEDRGLDWFRAEVEARLGYALDAPRPFTFASNADSYGWMHDLDGFWSYGLFVQNGRVCDQPGYAMRTALREIVQALQLQPGGGAELRLTPNQNLLLARISAEHRPVIEALLQKHRIDNARHSALRLNSMACVALPTCGLAFAESERYLPQLISKLEGVIDECGLRQDAITIRMTGCPNGCARPYVAEIAFVGCAPGLYNLYLGAGHAGERLNKLFRAGIGEQQIVDELAPILRRYATTRRDNEHFGDFVVRAGIVQATLAGRDFHKDTGPASPGTVCNVASA